MKSIRLWGVKQNNLKNISVEIPLGSFTVICGPSGSGKSSLAFETLYAEGQRRYIESLSNYARQFLNKAPQPDIEGIENIPPAIAIEQKNLVKTSRSTVGTMTEIIDYMRLLYEKLGVPYCPNGHGPIERETVSHGVEKIIEKLSGQRGYILAPVSKTQRVAAGKKLLEHLFKEGYTRLLIKKEMVEITPKTVLPAADFDIVIDRVVFREEDRGRLIDSLGQAYQASLSVNEGLTAGRARVLTLEGTELKVSEENSCTVCGFAFPLMSSRLFSFSSPVGACTSCNGFGNNLELDEKKIIPNPNISIALGAIHPFTMPAQRSDKKALIQFCQKMKIDLHQPWNELSQEHRDWIWSGHQSYDGVKGLFDYLETKKYKMHVRVFLARYKSPFQCTSCNGTRLRKEVQHIFISKKTINDLSGMTIERLLKFLNDLKLTAAQKIMVKEVFRQVVSRLEFLIEVGVHYLTIDRPTRTLSGGEYQRLNLANQLGMGLSQILYVLDEPTVGLHPRDNDRLISIMKKLKELGNTLVVVEHDLDVIRESERIIEMGPGSGHYGGEVLFSGLTEDFIATPDSLTAGYVRRQQQWIPAKSTRPVDRENLKFKLEIKGCTGHNLKNISVTFPLNRLVAVTGVSGSGKSSLITQTLYPALLEVLSKESQKALPFTELVGAGFIKEVILVDQKPIGRSSRSSPVTYLKVYDEIRKLMSGTDEAVSRGYGPGHFSLNIDGGRCPVCKGEGYETIDMQFMDDVTLVCDTCDGKRFRKEILEVYFQKKNIDEILNLTVAQAMDFFVNYPSIRRTLSILKEVGLDYLRIGQSARTLSGGESQRMKLAKEFSTAKQKSTLYILDEPTTGLHFREVELLLAVLNKLIDAGGSVIVIEHHLDVIKAADEVIEIGPDGGERGGEVIFQGSPEELAQASCPTSPYLRSDSSKIKPRPKRDSREKTI